MRLSRGLRLLAFALPLAGLVACSNNDDVTGSGGALATLAVDVPDTVHSGVPFDMTVSTTAVGVENVHNGVVTVTLPAGIQINTVTADAGTSETHTASTVTWTLNTLDSNTNSHVAINAVGTLAAGSASQTLTAQASMVADGINNGELTASDNFILAP
jgi:uncharacterized protein YfaS (alpha-2-macroglobulin family)